MIAKKMKTSTHFPLTVRYINRKVFLTVFPIRNTKSQNQNLYRVTYVTGR